MLKINLPSFKIDDSEILKEICLSLHAKQNLTILGSNGAGKSTLAKLLCGLLKSKDSIMIEDRYIESYAPDVRTNLINYIPPKLSIYESYITVEDFLQLGRYKQTQKMQDIEALLSRLGLKKLQKAYCISLSSGEQQLLLLASSLLHQAKITIFDEPTSNLDPQKIKLIFDILEKSEQLQQKIVITHNLQLAYKLNYPVLHMKEGVGTYHDSAEAFFETDNLNDVFQGAVIKDGDTISVKL